MWVGFEWQAEEFDDDDLMACGLGRGGRGIDGWLHGFNRRQCTDLEPWPNGKGLLTLKGSSIALKRYWVQRDELGGL